MMKLLGKYRETEKVIVIKDEMVNEFDVAVKKNDDKIRRKIFLITFDS